MVRKIDPPLLLWLRPYFTSTPPAPGALATRFSMASVPSCVSVVYDGAVARDGALPDISLHQSVRRCLQPQRAGPQAIGGGGARSGRRGLLGKKIGPAHHRQAHHAKPAFSNAASTTFESASSPFPATDRISGSSAAPAQIDLQRGEDPGASPCRRRRPPRSRHPSAISFPCRPPRAQLRAPP